MAESTTDSLDNYEKPTNSDDGSEALGSVERAAVELAAADVSDANKSENGDLTESESGEVISEDVLNLRSQFSGEIERLQAEVTDAKDQLVRTQAEMQNVRRRAERDVENAHKFALERFVKELLPVMDSLEKAAEVQGQGDGAIEEAQLDEGVGLTLKMFEDALAKMGVEVVDPLNQLFDPQFHEAMCMQPTADIEPNHVVAVMQRGYVLNGRLVRAARVMVSSAPNG